MTKATGAAQVIRKIGNKHLNLYKGEGYWYFIYDDVANEKYDSHSVYTMYLSHLTLEQWVEIGEGFLEKMGIGAA